MADLVFVYGALRREASNGWRMENARFLGSARIKGTLVRISWYPGLVREGEGSVLGEVYEVSRELLRQLDEFEGIDPGHEDGGNGEYRRLRTEIHVGKDTYKVWLYEWQKGIEDYEVIANGDWLSGSQ